MNISWATEAQCRLINQLDDKGVKLIEYKDPKRPRDDSQMVFNRKEFKEAVGIPLDDTDNRPANTYIYLMDAMVLAAIYGF